MLRVPDNAAFVEVEVVYVRIGPPEQEVSFAQGALEGFEVQAIEGGARRTVLYWRSGRETHVPGDWGPAIRDPSLPEKFGAVLDSTPVEDAEEARFAACIRHQLVRPGGPHPQLHHRDPIDPRRFEHCRHLVLESGYTGNGYTVCALCVRAHALTGLLPVVGDVPADRLWP